MDITLEHVTHTYSAGTPYSRDALTDVSLSIPSGSFLSIIGRTGSGKSTLTQHLNGLLKPTRGTIRIGDFVIKAGEKTKELKALRQRVGYVFQYPEHQLFEETLLKDVMFGPLNFGVERNEALQRAEDSLRLVDIAESLWQRSPFDLSGGQMRRVAIAGVLATHPEVVILDEPTAGLDPSGHKEIMHLFSRLHREEKRTIIMVTHNMSDAANYSNAVAVMSQGKLVVSGAPSAVFTQPDELRHAGLDLPEPMLFLENLASRLGVAERPAAFTLEQAADETLRLLGRGSAHV
ncbi:MAG: energy-coupling factor transporter ATPase [Sporolactobacillus sp.]